jgi:hypothetical protein
VGFQRDVAVGMALTLLLLSAYGLGMMLARHGIVTGITLVFLAVLSFALTSWLHRIGVRTDRDTET